MRARYCRSCPRTSVQIERRPIKACSAFPNSCMSPFCLTVSWVTLEMICRLARWGYTRISGDRSGHVLGLIICVHLAFSIEEKEEGLRILDDNKAAAITMTAFPNMLTNNSSTCTSAHASRSERVGRKMDFHICGGLYRGPYSALFLLPSQKPAPLAPST